MLIYRMVRTANWKRATLLQLLMMIYPISAMSQKHQLVTIRGCKEQKMLGPIYVEAYCQQPFRKKVLSFAATGVISANLKLVFVAALIAAQLHDFANLVPFQCVAKLIFSIVLKFLR